MFYRHIVSKGFGCVRAVLLLGLGAFAQSAIGQAGVTTYHNDIGRTGLNSFESILNPSNVNPKTFGLLYSLPVDGYVYAQPLYLSGVTIPSKGTHNVLFVATEHNSVYAFDADSNQGANAQPLWQVNLGPSVPYVDTGSGDIVSEIGITGTPVIAPAAANTPGATATLYVVAKTKTFDANNNPVYANRLHALNVTTGAEKFGGPVLVKGTVSGTGEGSDNTGHVVFNSLIQMDRSALLYLPNVGGGTAPPPPPPGGHSIGSADPFVQGRATIYVAFGSHGDIGPYHGWVFSYDATTLQQTGIMSTTPNARTDPSGYPIAAGGIWQGGAGLASDGNSIYFATGNGTFNPANRSFGDAILRLSTAGLTVADYFAPSNQQDLDNSDADLGSGGVMLLPAGAGSPGVPNLLVQSGKQGSIYLINRQNLGKFGPVDSIVQELPNVMGGIWGGPAYFNGNIYFGPIFGSVLAFPIKNAAFTSNGPNAASPGSFGYPGAGISVSSNGTTNGIVWALQTDGAGSGTPARLHAYTAANISTELYNSGDTQGRDVMGPSVKFAVPTIANGKVFAGTANSVGVFGLGQWTANPVLTPKSGHYKSSVTVKVTDSTPGAAIYYTTDGTIPTQSSNLYSGPVTFTVNVTFIARAFAPGYGPSASVQGDYQINATIGNGTGLLGSYFNNSQDPTTGTPTATRIDPLINWNWNEASPIDGVAGDNWAGQWRGKVEAEATTTYTFYSNSDDGVQVIVNGQKIIDNMTYHAPTIDSGSITLQRGVKYSIVINFFQGFGGSVLQLFWSAPGMPRELVPTSQLFHP